VLCSRGGCQHVDAGRSDTLVRPHHTQLLFEAYGSSVKKRVTIEGGHNTGRGALCLEEISSFLFSSFIFDDEGTRRHFL
jgi:hypothetical protein